MDMLRIKNHGGLLLETNYWDLPPKPGEVCFGSVNAGAFRLLLRPAAEPHIPDLLTARECVVSRGPWPAVGLADALEILFDDGTADPFALHLQIESFDRVPTAADAGREWTLSVWVRRGRGKPHQVLVRPCWYRLVPQIPHLQPRGESPL